MKEAPPESTENRRRRFGKPRWWLLALFLAACAYPAWREYDYQQAISEARAAGFQWSCADPITWIREDWRNVLKKETWRAGERQLVLGQVPDLGRYRSLIHRLGPTELQADGCKDESLDALTGITGLKWIGLFGCPNLQNINAIKELTKLRMLNLNHCPILQDIDALASLTDLHDLYLCDSAALQNINALKSLTSLQFLDLTQCDKIPASSLRELSTALPNTIITFPNGSNLPPQ